MVWDRDLDDGELGERLIYALLRPAVRMAMRSRLPMKELIRLTKLAYFQELRARGLTLQETAESMNTSMPTAARLSREIKRNFLRPEIEHQLPQRIEFMLWAEPLSRARLHQLISDHPAADIDEALDAMLEEERIVVSPSSNDVFALESPGVRLVRDSWFARIGSLNHILENLSNTVVTRFFEGPHEAFARTLNFRISAERFEQLQRFYEEIIWSSLVEFDEDAKGADEVRDVRLSLFWHAPGDRSGDDPV